MNDSKKRTRKRKIKKETHMFHEAEILERLYEVVGDPLKIKECN